MKTFFKILIAATVVMCGVLLYLDHRNTLKMRSGDLRNADKHTVKNSGYALPNAAQINQESHALTSGGSSGTVPRANNQNDSDIPPQGDQTHNAAKQHASPSPGKDSTNPSAGIWQNVHDINEIMPFPSKPQPGQKYYIDDGGKFVLGQINEKGQFVPVSPRVVLDPRNHVLSLAYQVLGVRRTYTDSSGQTIDEIEDPSTHTKMATVIQSVTDK